MQWLFAGVILTVSAQVYAQDWKLASDKDGINIYTRKTENSDFKSVKVESDVPATFSQIFSLLFDVDRHHEWGFHHKTSRLLKKLSDNEIVYYSEVNSPWPLLNRDFIVDLKATQVNGNLFEINSNALPDYLPEYDKTVRIRNSTSKWLLYKTGKGMMKIVYEMSFDPGGGVPAWVINPFITKGPYETFQKIRERVKMPCYQGLHYSFIKD